MEKRAISEAEIREIVKDELRSLLNPLLGQTTPADECLPTNQAYKRLGYKNQKQLYDRVADGLFRLGKEVDDRRKPGRKRPEYWFHIDRCLTRLSENPTKRRAV